MNASTACELIKNLSPDSNDDSHVVHSQGAHAAAAFSLSRRGGGRHENEYYFVAWTFPWDAPFCSSFATPVRCVFYHPLLSVQMLNRPSRRGPELAAFHKSQLDICDLSLSGIHAYFEPLHALAIHTPR